MKRFFTALSLCVMLFTVVPAFGDSVVSLPRVMDTVVQNIDFFTHPWVLKGYEDCFLYDVLRLNNARMGLVLISPLGFEIRLVYDVNTLAAFYVDMLLPEKSRREAMRSESVSIVGVVKWVNSFVKY